jgi:GTPase SAR1 family protein
MVFDVTRKLTYKNLDTWYEELQHHAPGIPMLVVANKIDIDYQVRGAAAACCWCSAALLSCTIT